MTIKSTLRSSLILASIFVVSWLGHLALEPLDNRIYDWCLKLDYDRSHIQTTVYRGMRMLSLSESTGPWTAEQTQQLQEYLNDSQVAAAAFYPGSHSELLPSQQDDTTMLAPADDAPSSSIVRDSDGICRRVALAYLDGGAQWQPTLPLRLMARLLNIPEDQIAFLPSAIRMGHRTIATDADYRILVRFRTSGETMTAETAGGETQNSREDFLPFALESVLHPDWKNAYSKQFRDNAVLVGTGFKEAKGIVTPLGPLSDFKVDACALETLMADLSLRAPTETESLTLVLIVTLVSTILSLRLPVAAIALFWALTQFVWLRLCIAMFEYNVFLSYTAVLVPSTVAAVVVSVLKLREASQALLRFGGAGAYEAAHRGDETVFEEIREKSATIVFTNVLSYLKEMERHGSPNDFFERRQAYAQLLSDVFRKHRGVILDYQGDFQMVGFNVELRSDDPLHAIHAVEASRDFLSQVPKLTRTWWEADDSEIGTAHCGICTGPVACGHVGSQRHDGGRIAQAAIGDTSNVAARLLGAAMKQKEPILMAMTTVVAADGQVEVDELEAIPLKGKAEAVAVARPKRVQP